MALTKDELIERRDFLGGSECAAAIGLSQWKSPLQLYREKKGLAEDMDEEEDLNLPAQVGQLVEPLVLLKLEQKKKIAIHSRQTRFVDPKNPWRRATVDGIGSDGLLVEAKTAGFIGQQWGKDDTDEIPLQYIYQIQHDLDCADLGAAWVPVIIGNTRIRIYRVERNEELIEILREGEKRFWRHVTESDPPPATTKQDLKILYPYDVHGMKPAIASVDVLSAFTKFEANKLLLKNLEERQEQLYAMIGEAFGDSPELVDSSGKLLATYKSQAGSSYFDTDALQKGHPDINLSPYYKKRAAYRVLRTKKPSTVKGKK